ncbi:MAG: hypothetical protein NO482_01990 [Candidatus Methanomethylicia archaeon]|nr:hypothetical protein [Candidatus Methanomethylicia archaeon]
MHGGKNCYLIAFLQLNFHPAEERCIDTVQENDNVRPQAAVIFEEPRLQLRRLCLPQVVEQVAQGTGIYSDRSGWLV